MRTAEIVAIGSELLTPSRSDTNSLWLTELLNGIGIQVMLKTVVGDDELRLEETLRDAIGRTDIVITTGGLGPTEDDITRKITARAVGKELEFRQELLDELREKFRSFGYEMPERNRQQAFVIKGSRVLPNPNGSAAGMLIETAKGLLVVLPGPPREARPMFEADVLPLLRSASNGIVMRRRRIMVSGLGESKLDELIAPIYTQYTNPSTSILFSKSEIEVQLTASAATESEAGLLLDELTAKIADKLGVSVFSTDGEKLEKVVGKLLKARGLTLAVAESCTGGLVAHRITEVAGSSEYFLEGLITYSNAAKTRLLGVPMELIDDKGAVSAAVAESMAAGARDKAGSDVAVSITGIAGPGGGSEEKPVGTVFVGYSDREVTRSLRLNFPGDRHLVRWRSSQAALDMVRRQILKLE